MSGTEGFRNLNRLREHFLDKVYHDTYSEERKRIQDRIIDSLVPHQAESDCIDENQWLICTAGPMASGKSYAVQWLLKEKQCFKELRRSMVTVDYDQIRKQLPESSHLAAESGVLTQKESGMIAELAVITALEDGCNVVLDGSMRDLDWHRQYMSKMKSHFQNLNIAILHVYAPQNLIVHRQQHRSLTENRSVPSMLFNDSLKITLNYLLPLAPEVQFILSMSNGSEVGRNFRVIRYDSQLEGVHHVPMNTWLQFETFFQNYNCRLSSRDSACFPCCLDGLSSQKGYCCKTLFKDSLIQFDQLSKSQDQNIPEVIAATSTLVYASAKKKLESQILSKISKFEEKVYDHFHLLDNAAELIGYNRDAIECAKSPIGKKPKYRENMMLSLPVKAEAK